MQKDLLPEETTVSQVLDISLWSVAWPCLVLAMIIGFIVVLRWFGNFENKSEAVGSDLNLVTFGFSADLLVQLAQEREILPGWGYDVSVLFLVILLFLFNLILYMVNLRLARFIEKRMASRELWSARALKLASLSIGILSACMFVFAQALWG